MLFFFFNIFMSYVFYCLFLFSRFIISLTAVGVVLTLNVDVRGRKRGNRNCRKICGS